MKENVEKTALERLHRRQSLIKDRIRAVVHQEANGVYLHGRPGSSKTYLICKTLEDLGVRYGYSNGHLTPLGLFDLLAENQNSVIVLDDVSSIFNAPQSLQILLAEARRAGGQRSGHSLRWQHHRHQQPPADGACQRGA